MTRGNPHKRRRGEAVRAVMMAVIKPGHPMPLDELMTTCGLSRAGVLRHLAALRQRGKIQGYTTALMMVRIW